MVRHIVMWNYKEHLTDAEKKEAAQKIVENLERLKDQIPGIISLKVVAAPFGTSDREIGLVGEYESFEALEGYAVHPRHVEAATFVKSVCCDRVAFDYEL